MKGSGAEKEKRGKGRKVLKEQERDDKINLLIVKKEYDKIKVINLRKERKMGTEEMRYQKATEKDTEQILELVQTTIKKIYPKYYPKEVVDFFCELHCKKKIKEDICQGNVSVLLVDGRLVGTGSYQDNHITRVYVYPDFQGKGYGSRIMEALEAEISLTYDNVYLDASLPASHLYEKRGYRTIKHDKWKVENDVVLVYEVMEKPLGSVNIPVSYEGRVFVPERNTENGSV